MKRRKWWFIGLALTLLAACVTGWKWSERPPYAFMEGSTVTDYFVNSDSTVIEFRSRVDIRSLKKRADEEMIPNGWEKVDISSALYGPEACDYVKMWAGRGDRADHVWLATGPGNVTLVNVSTRAGLLDRLKGWLWNTFKRGLHP